MISIGVREGDVVKIGALPFEVVEKDAGAMVVRLRGTEDRFAIDKQSMFRLNDEISLGVSLKGKLLIDAPNLTVTRD